MRKTLIFATTPLRSLICALSCHYSPACLLNFHTRMQDSARLSCEDPARAGVFTLIDLLTLRGRAPAHSHGAQLNSVVRAPI